MRGDGMALRSSIRNWTRVGKGAAVIGTVGATGALGVAALKTGAETVVDTTTQQTAIALREEAERVAQETLMKNNPGFGQIQEMFTGFLSGIKDMFAGFLKSFGIDLPDFDKEDEEENPERTKPGDGFVMEYSPPPSGDSVMERVGNVVTHPLQSLRHPLAALDHIRNGTPRIPFRDPKRVDDAIMAIERTPRACQAIEFFTGKGLSKEVACGLAAQIAYESGWVDNPGVYDGGRSHGIMQWHPPRQQDILAGTGIDVRHGRGATFEQQLEGMYWEFTQSAQERPNGDKVRKATTAHQAGDFASRYFVRPKATEQEAYERGFVAQAYFNHLYGPAPGASIVWHVPLQGGKRISGTFDEKRAGDSQVAAHRHGAIDIVAAQGTQVVSMADGTARAWRSPTHGNVVEVDHGGGISTLYAHLDTFPPEIDVGKSVTQKGKPFQVVGGQTPIGTVGSTGHSTGNHLHIEAKKNGIKVPPESVGAMGAMYAAVGQTAPTTAVASAQPPAALPGRPPASLLSHRANMPTRPRPTDMATTTQPLDPVVALTQLPSATDPFTIIVDPGHGGWSEEARRHAMGAESEDGQHQEADLNLSGAKALVAALRKRGYKAELTRTARTTDLLDRNARRGGGAMGESRAGQQKGDMFISVHYDSPVDKEGRPVKKDNHFLALHNGSAASLSLAESFAGAMGGATSHRPNLAVLGTQHHNDGKRPAVLLEMGNIKSDKDLAAALDPKLLKKKAEQLAATIDAHVRAQPMVRLDPALGRTPAANNRVASRRTGTEPQIEGG